MGAGGVNSDSRRMHQDCVTAIEDIRTKIKDRMGVEIPFVEGSRILGEKYIRGHLEVIPWTDIEIRYKRAKFRGRRRGCL